MDKTKLVTFRIEPDSHQKLRKIAAEEYRSVSEQIRFYVEKGIKGDDYTEKRLIINERKTDD